MTKKEMSDIDAVNSIVENSGNTFHCKVANYLQEKEWHTLVSPYYMDNATNKPREIDLIAEKAVYLNNMFGLKGFINIKLFIECKYIPQRNVFWFSDKDIASTKNWLANNTPLIEGYSFMNEHHYLASNLKVAKLFASENGPNVENEVIYKALNQSLNAMVYLRRRESIIPQQRDHPDTILYTIEIPVILCNSFDRFYRVDMEGASNPQKIESNFQLEVNYAYICRQGSSQSEFFLIDIIDFNYLDEFLELLEKDRSACFSMIDSVRD